MSVRLVCNLSIDLFLDTYIRWLLRNRCASKEQSQLFDLYKAFDYFESGHKSDIFLIEKTYFPTWVRNM